MLGSLYLWLSREHGSKQPNQGCVCRMSIPALALRLPLLETFHTTNFCKCMHAFRAEGVTLSKKAGDLESSQRKLRSNLRDTEAERDRLQVCCFLLLHTELQALMH